MGGKIVGFRIYLKSRFLSFLGIGLIYLSLAGSAGAFPHSDQPGLESPGEGRSGRGLYPAPLSGGVPPRPEGRSLPRLDDVDPRGQSYLSKNKNSPRFDQMELSEMLVYSRSSPAHFVEIRNWFIRNEYRLDLRGEQIPSEEAFKIAFSPSGVFQDVKRLNLSQVEMEAEWMEYLPQTLEILNISAIRWNEDATGLKHLARLNQLQSLSIREMRSFSRYEDRDESDVAELSVEGMKATLESFQKMAKNLPHLKKLDIGHNDLSLLGYIIAPHFPELEVLNLSDAYFSEQAPLKEILSRHPKLRILNLNQVWISDEVAETMIQRNPLLEVLTGNCLKATEVGILARGLKNLKRLSSSNEWKPLREQEQIEILLASQARRLENLELTRVTQPAVIELISKNIKDLRRLEVRQANREMIDSIIHNLENIDELVLQGAKLNEKQLIQLSAKFPNLQSLTLHFQSGISDSMAQIISQRFKNLKYLSVWKRNETGSYGTTWLRNHFLSQFTLTQEGERILKSQSLELKLYNLK